MNIDEIIGLLGRYPFVLVRGENYGDWILVVNNKVFKATDTYLLLKEVEKWRDNE